MKTLAALMLVCLTGCKWPTMSQATLERQQRQLPATVTPPPMPLRQIGPPPSTVPAGKLIDIDDNGTRFSLFVPQSFSPPRSDQIVLTVHFHGAIWFVIQEHLRRGLNGPLLCAALGEGSSVYRRPFEDRERFERLIKRVELHIHRRISVIDISSFSAGYGAVREIVKSPEYVKAIRRIVLADSMYASYEDEETAHPSSRPAREHIDPWIPFAKEAAAGNKTFVLTYSQVPTQNYASSALCAHALCEAIGVIMEKVMPSSIPATLDPQFPLQERADLRGFHIWGYGGSDAQAHMTHARHIAD